VRALTVNVQLQDQHEIISLAQFEKGFVIRSAWGLGFEFSIKIESEARQ
jgi:hypothetical protein